MKENYLKRECNKMLDNNVICADKETAAIQLLQVISGALRGDMPPAIKTEYLDFAQIKETAASHSLTAVLAYSLRMLNLKEYDELKERYFAVMRKSILVNRECERIYAALEEHKIRFMPLKGAILQHYYPEEGIREMSDVDILIDAQKSETVRELMEASGYQCVSFGQGHHDIYLKKPFYLFEIHRSLFDKGDYVRYHKYYDQIFDRLIRDEESEFKYRFTDEDFYIYFILHAGLHFNTAGTGLRVLVDLYFLREQFSDKVDRAYIRNELSMLGAGSFETQLISTVEAVFDRQNTKIQVNEFLRRIILSGTYGTRDLLRQKEMERSFHSSGRFKKFRYIMKRFRLPDSQLRDYYPFIYRHRWLEFLLWVYRPARKVISHSDDIIRELKILKKMK